MLNVEKNIIYVIIWVQVVKPNAVWFLNPQLCISKHNFRNAIHPFKAYARKTEIIKQTILSNIFFAVSSNLTTLHVSVKII